MIKAVIFDMDGLLIDSEPLWQKAEIDVFGKVGVPITESMTVQTMGLRVDEVVDYWHKTYSWKKPSKQEVAKQIDSMVLKLVESEGKPMTGAIKAIDICISAGLPVAIASSSSTQLISAVVNKLGIADKIKVINSAHDEEYGKPHPAVYINTATMLGVHPDHCLTFEDSINGVLSAKSAKMKCIAIPGEEIRDDKRFSIADMVLYSLLDFSPQMLKDW